MNTIAIKCSNCGAGLTPGPVGLFTCNYCKTIHTLASRPGSAETFVEPMIQQRPLSAWILQLCDLDATTRSAAAEVLSNIVHEKPHMFKDAVPALIMVLDEDYDASKAPAFAALTMLLLKERTAVPALIAAMRRGNHVAVSALAAIADPIAIPELLKAVRSSEFSTLVRLTSMWMLLEFFKQESIIPIIIQALRDPVMDNQYSADSTPHNTLDVVLRTLFNIAGSQPLLELADLRPKRPALSLAIRSADIDTWSRILSSEK